MIGLWQEIPEADVSGFHLRPRGIGACAAGTLRLDSAAIDARRDADMPLEEPVEVTRILETQAERDLLDGHVHLLQAHAGVLNHPVADEGAGRMAGIAHADRMEPVLRHPEGRRIAPDAPMLAVADLDELPELLQDVVPRAPQARFRRSVALCQPPEMQADQRQMSPENSHGDAIGASHLPGQGLEGMGDFVGAFLQALGGQENEPA